MSHRILVVEDNPDNRTLITDVLLSLKYKVIEAVDGVEGVTKAAQEKPDLILMDLSLPHKDGWTATREIKADPALTAIPIIALTAHALKGDRERCLEAGMDEYVAKPIHSANLLAKISAVVRALRRST